MNVLIRIVAWLTTPSIIHGIVLGVALTILYEALARLDLFRWQFLYLLVGIVVLLMIGVWLGSLVFRRTQARLLEVLELEVGVVKKSLIGNALRYMDGDTATRAEVLGSSMEMLSPYTKKFGVVASAVLVRALAIGSLIAVLGTLASYALFMASYLQIERLDEQNRIMQSEMELSRTTQSAEFSGRVNLLEDRIFAKKAEWIKGWSIDDLSESFNEVRQRVGSLSGKTLIDTYALTKGTPVGFLYKGEGSREEMIVALKEVISSAPPQLRAETFRKCRERGVRCEFDPVLGRMDQLFTLPKPLAAQFGSLTRNVPKLRELELSVTECNAELKCDWGLARSSYERGSLLRNILAMDLAVDVLVEAGADFSASYLEKIPLKTVNLSGLQVNNSTFSEMELEYFRMRNSNMTQMNFIGVHAIGAEFEGSDMSGTRIFASEFIYSDFEAVNFRNAKFGYSVFKFCNFFASQMNGLTFETVGLEEPIFSEAQMKTLDFDGVYFLGLEWYEKWGEALSERYAATQVECGSLDWPLRDWCMEKPGGEVYRLDSVVAERKGFLNPFQSVRAWFAL